MDKTAEVVAYESLSEREKEIAEAMHRGLSRIDIAAALGISGSTLHKHLEKIFLKLGVGSATQMVLAVERAKVTR